MQFKPLKLTFFTFVDEFHPELNVTAPKTALQCLTEVVKQFEKRKYVVLQ